MSDTHFENNFVTWLKYINPSVKYIHSYPNTSLHDLTLQIYKKKSWTISSATVMIDRLYEEKKKNFSEKNNSEKLKTVDYLLDYVNHQKKVISDYQGYLLTIVATIFLPLSFLVGYFGMNFF